MKFKHLLVAIAVSLSALTSAQAGVLTDFDVEGGLIVEYDWTTFLPENIDTTGGSLRVQGEYGNVLGVSFDSVDISGLNQIYLTTTLHATETTSFQLWLYNTENDEEYMKYEGWFENVGSSHTILLEYMSNQDYSPFNNIIGFDFFTDGSPSNPLDITFESLTAVPEPHTYALILTGLLAGGLIIRRQRLVKR